MSEICNKLGISEETLKKQIQYGMVSTSWPFYDEIVMFYKEVSKTKERSEAVKDTADKFKIDVSTVYKVIKKPFFK